MKPQAAAQPFDELFGSGIADFAMRLFMAEQFRILPDGFATFQPVHRQRPTRQLLAGVPLALPKVIQASLAVILGQLVQHLDAVFAFGGAQRVDIPLGSTSISVGHKSGFATHGQAHVERVQCLVHFEAQRLNAFPLFFVVGLAGARRLIHPLHAHFMFKFNFTFIQRASDGGCTARLGSARQGYVPFASQQTRSGVQPYPAGTGQIHLAPGMQVGEIFLRAIRAVDGFDIACELDQVARGKPCRHAQPAEYLYHEPCRVTAGTRPTVQCFIRRLHARFHADQVLDSFRQILIQGHQKVDGFNPAQVHLGHVGVECLARVAGHQVGCQFLVQRCVIFKREELGGFFEEKIEGIQHRHFSHKVHRNFQHLCAFGKYQATHVIALRVLLPVDEVGLWQHFHAVTENTRAAMRGRA